MTTVRFIMVELVGIEFNIAKIVQLISWTSGYPKRLIGSKKMPLKPEVGHMR